MRVLALALALVLGATPAWAADFPSPTGYLVDQADAIPAADEQALESELTAYAERSTHQLAVAVVKSTAGESIEDYANDLFGKWGVGDKSRNDGVLILVAVQDRQLRIEVGRGLEGDLTDVQAADIVRDVMVPSLRAGNVVEAVRSGERAVRRDLGDPTPDAAGSPTSGFTGYGGGAPSPRSSSGTNWFPLVAFGLVAFFLFSSFGRRRGRRRRGFFAPVFFGSGWGGGGGFGGGGFGGGGGGFGGFGGGSSGGGGASGSW